MFAAKKKKKKAKKFDGELGAVLRHTPRGKGGEASKNRPTRCTSSTRAIARLCGGRTPRAWPLHTPPIPSPVRADAPSHSFLLNAPSTHFLVAPPYPLPPADEAGGEAPADGADAGAASSDAAPGPGAAGVSASTSAPVMLGDGETADTYDEMLSRIFGLLHENNPELLGREKKRLKPPQVSRVGTTRTAWTNFKDICASLKRTPDHILSFYLAELGTTGAIDGSERLMLKGKFQPKYIESLLRKYITEYVQCHMCRNTETELTRDPIR
jgi:translation initiation factor 2 beta subunit (eIF-2beta)/eIF-5